MYFVNILLLFHHATILSLCCGYVGQCKRLKSYFINVIIVKVNVGFIFTLLTAPFSLYFTLLIPPLSLHFRLLSPPLPSPSSLPPPLPLPLPYSQVL